MPGPKDEPEPEADADAEHEAHYEPEGLITLPRGGRSEGTRIVRRGLGKASREHDRQPAPAAATSPTVRPATTPVVWVVYRSPHRDDLSTFGGFAVAIMRPSLLTLAGL